MTVALAELGEAVFLKSLDELVGKFFRREIRDAGVGVAAEDGVTNGVHQVGFTQPGVAIEEEGVVGLSRGLGDREGGGVGHLVVGADDEGLEGIAGVECAGGGAAFVVASGFAGAGTEGGAAAGDSGFGTGTRAGFLRAGGAELYVNEATGAEAKALGDQVEVVVVNPDLGELVGDAEGEGVFGGFKAHHGLEPHMEDIFREERLEVAFHGFPKAGRERKGRHERAGKADLFTDGRSRLFYHVRSGLHPGSRER